MGLFDMLSNIFGTKKTTTVPATPAKSAPTTTVATAVTQYIISANAIAMAARLIAQEEGMVLTPYQDVGGVWTIGCGTTVINGQPVTGETPAITEAEAEALLAADLETVRVPALQSMLKVDATDGQCAALLSFLYNEGVVALGSSTLMKLFNEGDVAGAAAQFPLWNIAGGKVVQGLVNRRAVEEAIFLGTQTI